MKLLRNLFKNFIQTPRKYRKMTSPSELAASPGMKLGVPTRVRENPAITKLDTPEFKSIFNEELCKLIDIFKKYNFELRIAGGAVRDLLMNIAPKDIDLATTATPKQMKDMFGNENVRLINLNGEKHGTITPRINDKENFEVTTLRIDVRTNGRHAEVEFTTDWQLDANRRDLTINSMFLGFDGTLYDYFYGYQDLQQRRVVFVGDASVRIKEDYLRILRYFRFYGRISSEANQHDEATLKAIRDNGKGLSSISGERKWQELQKILVGNFGHELMLKLLELDLGTYCGLPTHPNIEEFDKFCETLKLFNGPHHPILFMTSLLYSREDALNLHNSLKLSAFERDLAFLIVQQRKNVATFTTLHECIVMCLQPYVRLDFVLQLLKYCGKPELYKELQECELPKFPLNGNIIKEQVNVKSSLLVGTVLNELKDRWIKSDFQLNKEQLLEQLPEVLDNKRTAAGEHDSPHKRRVN